MSDPLSAEHLQGVEVAVDGVIQDARDRLCRQMANDGAACHVSRRAQSCC